MGRGTGFWSDRGRTLQTRVGRRVVVLFIVCAVLPVAVLGIASYVTIADSLREQAFERARLTAKRIGAALIERFGNLESSLISVAANVSNAPSGMMREATVWDPRFAAVAVIVGDSQRLLLGALPAVPELTARQQRHLQSGGTIMTLSADTAGAILMARQITIAGKSRGLIWAQLSDSVVDRVLAAETVTMLPASSCIVVRGGPVVRCTDQTALRRGALGPALMSEPSGAFVWESNERYLAGFWSLFLDAEFASPDWRIIFSEPEDEVLAPLTRFRRVFALAAALAILIVAFLSTGQIRRSLGPLAALRLGTERIAHLKFDRPVEVKSGDEFEDLADSFNSMSDRVRAQFLEANRMNQALANKSEELQEREARLAAILDAAVDAIVTVDATGRLESFNRTAERIFGLPETEAVGRPLNDLFGVPLVTGPGSLQASSEVGSQMLEVAGRRRDGAMFPAEVRFTEARAGDRILHTVFIRDISERRRTAEERERLEAQLRHAQKMETIGTLAGGIAHDFNNILTPIIGNVELALGDPTSPDIKDDLEQVLGAAMRAKDLVRQILLFSRRGETAFSTIEVGPIVSGGTQAVAGVTSGHHRDKVVHRSGCRARRGRSNTAASGADESVHQRVPRHAGARRSARCASRHGRRRHDHGRPRRRPARRPTHGARYRTRHGFSDARAVVRAFLHHQAGGRRHGTWHVHCAWNHHPPRRNDHGSEHARIGYHVRDPSSVSRTGGGGRRKGGGAESGERRRTYSCGRR